MCDWLIYEKNKRWTTFIVHPCQTCIVIFESWSMFHIFLYCMSNLSLYSVYIVYEGPLRTWAMFLPKFAYAMSSFLFPFIVPYIPCSSLDMCFVLHGSV